MEQISIYLPGILLAYSAFMLAIMSPAPNVLAVMGTSMSVDRRSGLALTMGVAGTTVLSVVTRALYAVAFSSAPMVRLHAGTRRLIQGTLGAFFAFAGLKLLSSRA